MTDQPVFVVGGGLQALEAAEFETEAEFQELLARHPRVLDFGTLVDGRPLRLALVAREMPVPTGPEGGAALALDHLFVDADAVVTLVEVKRAGDTRIRREVVGQMLDYAANGSRYWPAALLRHSFEQTCAKDGGSLEEAYGELLGGRTPDEFWAAVEERLAAGRMRLLFVADRIPMELRAVVEFLNRQMRTTDVYAVELTQYRGDGDLRVLVPRVHGEAATVAKVPSARRAVPRRSRKDMDDAVAARCAPEVQRVVRRLLDHAEGAGRIEGGTAQYPSVNLHYRVGGRWVPVGTVSLFEGPAQEGLSFSFGSISHHLGQEAAAAFAERLPAVGGLPQKLAEQRLKGYGGWPSVSLAALAAEPGAVDQLLTAIEHLR
ncbi:hypothetical protein [Streptomyces sp. NPDC048111]|uniref:hypothetical protein n=1 Tax=Streptomyces sp. NPDC048111 TaxID=3365500 RepID=UPI00371CB944